MTGPSAKTRPSLEAWCRCCVSRASDYFPHGPCWVARTISLAGLVMLQRRGRVKDIVRGRFWGVRILPWDRALVDVCYRGRLRVKELMSGGGEKKQACWRMGLLMPPRVVATLKRVSTERALATRLASWHNFFLFLPAGPVRKPKAKLFAQS